VGWESAYDASCPGWWFGPKHTAECDAGGKWEKALSGRRGTVEQAEQSVRDYEMKSVTGKGSDDGSMVVVEEDIAMRDIFAFVLENGEILSCNKVIGSVIPVVEPGSESFLTRSSLKTTRDIHPK
jgi:hypothetical protein